MRAVLGTAGPLWIGVWSGNDKAQRLYAAYGFEKAGEYDYPVGAWRDREAGKLLSLQFSGNQLIGCNSVGWTEHVGVMRGLVEGQVKLGTEWKQRLINDPTQRASAQYIRMFRDTAIDSVMATRGLFPVLQKAMNWVKPPAMEQEEYDDLRAGWQHPDTAFGMINWYRASPIEVPPISVRSLVARPLRSMR